MEMEVEAASGSGAVTENDRYCWSCHLPKDTLSCLSCPRSFHPPCVAKEKKLPLPTRGKMVKLGRKRIKSLVKCQECLGNEETAYEALTYVKKETVVKMLELYCQKHLKESYNQDVNCVFVDLSQDKEALDAGKNTPRPMDINKVEMMVKNGKIQTVEGFVGELRWIYHNNVVYYGHQDTISKDAKALLAMAYKDLNTIVSECVECYVHRVGKLDEDWFIKPCSLPHVIGWGKLEGFPWWPIKVISIFQDEAIFEWFGDHMRGQMKSDKLYFYSEQSPKEATKNTSAEQLRRAKSEAERYMSAMAEKFGRVEFASHKMLLSSLNLDVTITNQLFPEYRSLQNQQGVAQPPSQK